MQGYKYSAWDGTQGIDLDPEEILSELADDILERGDLRQALRRMTQRGMRGQNLMGLQDLMQRLRQRRQQQLERFNLDSSVDALKEALEEILRLEQEGIQRRLDQARQRTKPPAALDTTPEGARDRASAGSRDQTPGGDESAAGSSPSSQPSSEQPQDGLDRDQAQRLREFMERMAAEKLDFLKDLPPELGGALAKLKDYEFWDSEAKQKYDELMEQLKQQMAQQMFQGMQQGMQGMQQQMTPGQMEAMREMLQDLNQMLRDRLDGREPNFDQFMQQWGDAFGPNPPRSLDELLDQLQDRAQQMQSLMDSLSVEQRTELEQLSQSLMEEMGLQNEMAELAANLGQLFPQDRPGNYRFRGDDPVTLQEAMRLMEEMARMEDLEASLKRAQTGNDIPEADVEAMRELLGEEEAQQLENLRDLARKLEEAGFVQRKGDRLELTPRGIRKLGQKALRDIFEKLKRDRVGNHELDRRGAGGEALQETKPYEFGDPFLLDLEKTVMNAVERAGPGVPVRLEPVDFEIYRTEHHTQCATVLLLDQSRSMGYSGRFLAAKKVALALQSLIRGQFPRDNLYVVGFSAYATEIKHDDLAKVTWNYDSSGTNMQHALMLSRQYLARHKGGTRQIIMVTDGEPTAHLERGYAYFSYPPTHRTIQETLREVRRCTREGITINTFMLEQSYYLVEFMGQVAKLNRGRVFYSGPESLGQYVLVDYLGQKRRKIS